MEKFILLNQQALFSKLNTARHVDNCYNCNDIIEILSESKARDMRLIGNYTTDEIVVKKVFVSVQFRRMRYFTQLGISRYLHEGKIFSYANACVYFSVQPLNKEHIKWKKTVDALVTNEMFETNGILRWLFEKKKSCVALGDYVTIDDISLYLEKQLTYNKERANWLLTTYQ